ncbi:hypothetical protein KY363_00400 [Candidatus Woesearchaeota archaeon]|nr:hypothetical protein [Candidatus Woesearchaeota archaeon]
MTREKRVAQSALGSFAKSVWSGIRSSRLLRLAGVSIRSVLRSWPFLLLSILFDFLFLIATGTVITLIQFSLFEHLEAIMEMTGEVTGGLMNIYNDTAGVSAGMMSIPNNPDFQFHVNVIFKYLGIMVLATLIIWMVFQGLSWFIAYRMSHEKKERIPFLAFWRDFAIKTIPFYALTVLLIFLSVRLLLTIKMSMTPWMGEDALNAVFILLVLITWYFGSVAYTLVSGNAWSEFKASFSFGFRKFPKVIQSFLLVAVLFLIIDQVLRIPFIAADPFLKIIFGVLIFMPAIVFTRVLLFNTTREYLPEHKAKIHAHKAQQAQEED